MRKQEKAYDLRIEDVKGKNFVITNVKEYASDRANGHLYYREGRKLKYIRFRKLRAYERREEEC